MSDQPRRKLLKSIIAGSGAILAGKSLPDSWAKPVVDSVMLPAHAQTSQALIPPPSGPFSSTLSDGPVASGGTRTFNFDVTGFIPTGDGTVDIIAIGDIANTANEDYEIFIEGTSLGLTSIGTLVLQQCDGIGVSDSFNIFQADLIAAAADNTITITAVAGAGVAISGLCVDNTVTATLSFPG